MSTKNMLKSKKAISPILATLLLIVIAVAAIVVTYAWVMTYMTSAGHQAGTWIQIDNGNINATSSIVTVYVRNRGSETAVIDIVYIEGTDVTDHVTTPTLPKTIPVGNITTIEVNCSGLLTFTAGSYYNVKVSGQAGATTGDVPVKAK